MVKRLKAGGKERVLERFIVDGENISVRIDGQGVLPISEYRRPVGPPAAAGVTVQSVPMQPRRESVPGAATSIYNRSLYQPEQPPPARTRAPQHPASQPPQQPPATPQHPGQAQQPPRPGP